MTNEYLGIRGSVVGSHSSQGEICKQKRALEADPHKIAFWSESPKNP